MPFVSYALISDKIPSADLRQLAKYQIAPLLAGIPGVAGSAFSAGDAGGAGLYQSPEAEDVSG